MTHGSDIIRADFSGADLPRDAQRQALLFQMLMSEGMARLIRHRLDTARPPAPGTACPVLLLITQLRQSGMARLTHDRQGLHLSMHGFCVHALTARGVLCEWANAVLGRA